MKRQPNYLGDYCSLIRVNGNRTCIGTGHTARESEIHALQAAKEAWPVHSHIFDLLLPENKK